MSTTVLTTGEATPWRSDARRFGASVVLVAVVACLLAGWLPLGVSIVTVFLFAGPHNWVEARYFLSRMPGRWGKLTPYFTTGLAGVVALTATFAAIPALAAALQWDREGWLVAIGCWNTALVAWIVVLALMRARVRPYRDWVAIVPCGCGLIAVNWLSPVAWDLALVYLHPLVALWFLDREIQRERPAWSRAFRRSLMVVPVLLCGLWWNLRAAESLPGEDALTQRIAAHAGAGILTGINSHLLVSTHVFLETLHYAVWLVAIPLVSLSPGRWSLRSIPLARRSVRWKRAVVAVLLGGLAVTVVLWAGFLADYPLTRDIYFTVALLHVLAEAPFLLRLL